MNRITNHAWRLAFVASGVAMLIGGPRHPDADAEDSLREELATMTAHDDWWLAHSFIVASTALLAIGLWLAHRHRSWPGSLRRALRITAVIVSAYLVETVFHLASAVDTDALRDGDAAPVAFTHVGLALVLYPLSGFAIAYLSAKIFTTVQLHRKPLAAIGVAAGTLHALSVPLTVAFPDTEFTLAFAGSAILLAGWALGTGLTGVGSSEPAPGREATAEAPAFAGQPS
jgi:uncharacterized membrane protein YozB (DUF420 family)